MERRKASIKYHIVVGRYHVHKDNKVVELSEFLSRQEGFGQFDTILKTLM